MKKLNHFLSIIYWRLLRKSKVFNYFYKRHLTELLFKLEIFDIEGKEITKFYKEKLINSMK